MTGSFTGHYKVASGEYLGAIARSMLGRMWWLLMVPLALFIAGFSDWRWAALGLIVLMLLYPFAITTALLSHALRPEVVRRAASVKAQFDNGTITVFKQVDDRYEATETVAIIDIIPAGNLTKIIVGERIFDFILIPTEEVPMSLLS